MTLRGSTCTAAARWALPPLLLLLAVTPLCAQGGARDPAPAPSPPVRVRVPQAPAAPTALAALRFETLTWGAPRAEVEVQLARLGFARAAGDEDLSHRGRALGRAAWLGTEVTPRGGLLAVSVCWRFATAGEALQTWRAYDRRLRAKWGAPALVIDPQLGAPASRWRYWRPWREEGEPSAASLWTAANGDAAILQLDGARRVWLRLESHEWNVVHGTGASEPLTP